MGEFLISFLKALFFFPTYFLFLVPILPTNTLLMEIGLFISHDEGRISEILDLESLSREYDDLGAIRTYDSFFSLKAQKSILKTIQRRKLEGVVFAGNSPDYFEHALSGSNIIKDIQKLGINKNKIGFANIRELVALPHQHENGSATQKAKLLIDVALNRVETSHAAKVTTVATRKSVLIIGANSGGIIACNELLKKGYRIYLLDKHKSFNIEEEDMHGIQPSLTAIKADAKTTIFFQSSLADVSGFCGDFRITIKTKEGTEEISVGGIILSLGKDTELTKELKPLLALDTDNTDMVRSKNRISAIGSTVNPGIWFIPVYGKENLNNALSGANIAVLQLTTILDRHEIEHPELISEVDETACGGCGTCVKTCAFGASSIDIEKKLSHIDTQKCRGCGNCVVACPTSARDLITFPRDYIVNAIEIMSRKSKGPDSPKILAFLCNGCGYPAADLAGELAAKDPSLGYSSDVMPLKVECGGNIGTQYVLEAFYHGFDGVALTICRDGHCHHVVGNTDMERRVSLFRTVLRSRNIDDNRMRIIKVSPHEGKLFSKEIQSFVSDLKENQT